MVGCLKTEAATTAGCNSSPSNGSLYLNAASVPNSLAARLPAVVGRAGYSLSSSVSAGLSLEATFNAVSATPNGSLFSCSELNGEDGIWLSWDEVATSIILTINGTNQLTVPLVAGAHVGVFYYVFVALDSSTNQQQQVAAKVYVDGQLKLSRAIDSSSYPAGVTRSLCILVSDWSSSVFSDWELDSLRLYDYVLLAEAIGLLVGDVDDNCGVCHLSMTLDTHRIACRMHSNPAQPTQLQRNLRVYCRTATTAPS